MRRLALLCAAAMLSACDVPTRPGLPVVPGQTTSEMSHRDAAVVRVAAPTGNAVVDVANIQAAVDAATQGARIQFAPGTYAVEASTQFVVSTPGVTLQGDGRRTTIKSVMAEPSPDAPFFRGVFYLNGGDQTVRWLTFDGFMAALSFGTSGTTVGGYRVEQSTFRSGYVATEFFGFSDAVSVVERNEFVNTTRPVNIFGKTVHFRHNRMTVTDLAAMPFGQPFFAGFAAPDFLTGGTICENNVFENNLVIGFADGFTLDAFPGENCRNNIIRENEFIRMRLYGIFPPEPFFNGTLAWLVNPGAHDGNRIVGNVLRGSEGIGIIVEAGSDNWIVDNRISDLPGELTTGFPYPGTAIVLGEAASGNRVRGNEFKNVVNTIVDLGTGNVIKGNTNGNLVAASSVMRLRSPSNVRGGQASESPLRLNGVRGRGRN
jgi:hypothetical protein